jgi:DNA polymerase
MQNENADLLNSLAALEAAEHYLRQQQGLYGNIIYRSSVPETTEDVTYEAAAEEHSERRAVVHEPAPAHQATPVREPVRVPVREAASVPAPVTHAVHEPWQDAGSLADLNAAICSCTKCPLGATRTKFVFGVGRIDSGVMVIGEAPGADEDAQGEPFVGKAGQLLTKILEAVKFERSDVFIANILKCRPPGNRKPSPTEVELCEPYLWKQIELVKPKIILCLGLTAAQTLLQSASSLGVLRESVQTYRGIPLIVTYHPAALLRNPNWKRPTWEDVQKFRKMYDDIIAAG